MPIEYQARYSRRQIQANPQKYYVFGDNMARTGYGGQAAEARGEPNTIGIPTKWAPTRNEADYFDDLNPQNHKAYEAILVAINLIQYHLSKGDTVVFPADGIGTGLAELPTRAPLMYSYIKSKLDLLSVV